MSPFSVHRAYQEPTRSVVARHLRTSPSSSRSHRQNRVCQTEPPPNLLPIGAGDLSA
jgi:hypothetical protein